MKRYIIACLFILSFQYTVAQDSMVLLDSSIVEGYIESINEKEITYAKKQGKRALYSLSTRKVAYILFADGSRDNLSEFGVILEKPRTEIPSDTIQAYVLGRADGFKNYDQKGVKAWTAVTTFLLPPVGLATAISTSATPPSDALVKVTSQNIHYRDGYLDGAILKKRKRAWGGFGLGFGILLGAAVILSVGSN
jgi:hypothetical protein